MNLYILLSIYSITLCWTQLVSIAFVHKKNIEQDARNIPNILKLIINFSCVAIVGNIYFLIMTKKLHINFNIINNMCTFSSDTKTFYWWTVK